MSNVIGHATLNVVPSTKGFGSSLNGALGPLGDSGGRALGGSVGGAFRSVVGPLMAVAGAVGMGAFIGASIKSAGALEQSMGALDVVFKDSAGQMHNWATGAATSVGLARNEYNDLAVLIGSQLKNAGTAMDELGPKTDDLITAGADMASMFGGTTKDAVEAISSALKGERDPIERYGVSLKQTTIDAKAAAMGFEKVDGALTSQAQAAATLALIMEQTGDAQGNFAREAQTYEGVMQRLKASWSNVTATIGQGFLPIATAAGSILLGMMPSVQGLADKFAALAPGIQGVVEILLYGNYDGGLMRAFGNITEDSALVDKIFRIREAFLGLTELLLNGDYDRNLFTSMGLTNDSAVVEFLLSLRDGVVGLFDAFRSGDPAQIGQAFAGLFLSILESRGALIEAIGSILPVIVETLAAAIPSILTSAIGVFHTLIDAVVLILPLLVETVIGLVPIIVEALVTLIPALIEGAIMLFTALVQAIPLVIPPLIEAVISLLPVIIEAVVSLIPMLIEGALSLFMAIITAIPLIIPSLIDGLLALLPQIVRTVLGMLPQLLRSAVDLFTGIVRAVPQIIPELIPTLLALGPEMVGALLGLVPDLIGAGIDLIGGLVAGLWDAAASVGAALLDIVGGAVDGFLSFLGIHSPSRLFRGFGVNIGEGLDIGIRSMADDIEDSAGALAQAAVDGFGDPSLDIDGGVMGSNARLAAALDGSGSGDTFTTIYHDHSTSQEDKAAKLARAEANLRASASAGRWR